MMKTAYGKLALFAAFALASVALLVPAAPATPAPPSAPVEPEDREPPQSVFAGTAIGVVLEANGNEVPKSGSEMMAALAKVGEFVQLPIAFSAVDLHSGLAKPRVVIAQRPSMIHPGRKFDENEFPGMANPTPPVLTALNTGTLTKPNLEGRLFLAANLEKKDGKLKVKTFEFISWNSRKQKFDFGFIECDDVEPQIRVVDGVRCFSCHKNKGPILGQGPWSNSTHNDVMRTAVTTTMRLAGEGERDGGGRTVPINFNFDLGQPRRLDTGFVSKGMGRPMTFDGMSVFLPQGPAVDASVRLGAELMRDREVFRQMTRTADGRRGLVVLFGALAMPGALAQNNESVKAALNREFNTNYANFAHKVRTITMTSTSTLVDFNPSGSQGLLQNVVTQSSGGWGGGSTLSSELRIVWSGNPKQVTEYDAKRTDGEHALPSNRQPSNPKAFVPGDSRLPGTPAAAVNATSLARLIGLTEGDRTFLAAKLSDAAERVGKKATAATLAKEVFNGSQFSELLTAGEIPDREDFKDRFVKGLNAVLKAHNADEFQIARRDYASGPNVAPVPSKEEVELAVVATTACLRCHDVRGVGKATFNPIPALAFDPFDQKSRDTWAKITPVKTRVEVLARMMKRLAEDRDMPPEDSAEYEQFRAKNPAAFDAVKGWVETELQSAK